MPEGEIPQESQCTPPEAPESDKDVPREKVLLKARKPYKKKSITQVRKAEPTKPFDTQRRLPRPTGKEIDLGNTRKRSRLTAVEGGMLDESSDQRVSRTSEEVTISLESPYVEISLDEGEVSLVLPKQRFKSDTTKEVPQYLSYSVELNGQEEQLTVNVTRADALFALVEERRICLHCPLKKFRVKFPHELQRRVYSYNHMAQDAYVFVAIGSTPCSENDA